MFADDLSFQASINVKHALNELNTRITKTFTGSPDLKRVLSEHTKKLENTFNDHTMRILTVFELGGTANFHAASFDPDGDDDILKFNFGGENVELQRSCLTKPVIGWNLFSCLFEKKWDRYHVRDRTGRIYIDLKEEWMRPLIDYMKHNKSVSSPIKSVDIFLRRTLELFCLTDKLRFKELVAIVPWVGLESSPLFNQMTEYKNLFCRSLSMNFYPSIPTSFKLIYSKSSTSPSLPLPFDVDIRFKPIFCLWKAANRKLFVIFLTWAERPSRRSADSYGFEASSSRIFRIVKCEKEITTLSDLFPIQFECNEIENSINNPQQENEVLEIYEVYSSIHYEATPKSPLKLTEPNKLLSAEDHCSNPCPLAATIEEWCSRLKEAGREILTVEDQLNEMKILFREEESYLSKYFHSCWKVERDQCR
jgi:hypothetical protein